MRRHGPLLQWPTHRLDLRNVLRRQVTLAAEHFIHRLLGDTECLVDREPTLRLPQCQPALAGQVLPCHMRPVGHGLDQRIPIRSRVENGFRGVPGRRVQSARRAEERMPVLVGEFPLLPALQPRLQVEDHRLVAQQFRHIERAIRDAGVDLLRGRGDPLTERPQRIILSAERLPLTGARRGFMRRQQRCQPLRHPIAPPIRLDVRLDLGVEAFTVPDCGLTTERRCLVGDRPQLLMQPLQHQLLVSLGHPLEFGFHVQRVELPTTLPLPLEPDRALPHAGERAAPFARLDGAPVLQHLPVEIPIIVQHLRRQ